MTFLANQRQIVSLVFNEKNKKVALNSKIDNVNVFPLELNTMPGWAGSSWYFYRYMDPKNNNEFISDASQSYWSDVDVYFGGSESDKWVVIFFNNI